MNKQIPDGVINMLSGYLRFDSHKGDCLIMFPCADPETFNRINSLNDVHNEYDKFLIKSQEEIAKANAEFFAQQKLKNQQS